MIPWLSGCLLLAAAVPAASSPVAATKDEVPGTVGAIVERYVKASGGPALRRIRAETRRGTVIRGQFGQVPVETKALPPGRWLYHQVFAYGDQVKFGCDGNDAWVQDTRAVETLAPRQRMELVFLLDPQVPLRLRELCPRLELIGGEKVGEREAHTLRATSPEGVSTELAFDRETGLLLRAGEMRFEDYREVDGAPRPHRVRLGTTDEDLHLEMKLEFAETRHGTALDGSEFRRPRHNLPMTQSPLYEDRKEVAVGAEAMNACVGVYQHSEKADVTYTVTVWKGHLMLQRTGWPLPREIFPASETQYFTRFPYQSFRFVRDETGRVTLLDIGKGTIRAARIQ